MLLFGVYVILKIHTFYGIFIIILSVFFIYGRTKKPRLVFRIYKNGIWTEEFGFVYFCHIGHFEFYRRISANTSSEWVKISIKNHQLYKMDKLFFDQKISHIYMYGNLKIELNNALTIANKRNENKKEKSKELKTAKETWYELELSDK